TPIPLILVAPATLSTDIPAKAEMVVAPMEPLTNEEYGTVNVTPVAPFTLIALFKLCNVATPPLLDNVSAPLTVLTITPLLLLVNNAAPPLDEIVNAPFDVVTLTALLLLVN